jgi:hypothetical protein
VAVDVGGTFTDIGLLPIRSAEAFSPLGNRGSLSFRDRGTSGEVHVADTT